jgi:hypothetical protein
MNTISKEYTWNIKDNFIYIYNYKKNQKLKIIFYNKDDNEELDQNNNEELDQNNNEKIEYKCGDTEDSNESEDNEGDYEEYYEEEKEDIIIDINNIYDEDNIDFLNAKNLLNSIILPRTYSQKYLIAPIQYYRSNNKIIVLGSHAITNFELLRILYEFYNVKVLTKYELEEINNDDYWDYVDSAKELSNPHYSNTIGLLSNFEYIVRIENDIFRLELNKYGEYI